MKKLFAALTLLSMLSGFVVPAFADTAAAPASAAASAAAASPAAAAPTAAPAADAPAPKCGDKGFDCNKGDVSWMMTSTAFVLLMTVPGLALFYSGMVRNKNALSTVMQSFAIFCVIAVLWVIYGYSAAFTAGHDGNALAPFIGSLDKFFMSGDDPTTAVAATFSKGQYIPDYVYAMFQLTFAAITVALICGGFAERFKFSAMIIFSVLWFTFAYLPISHMVWYWDGPDAYTSAKAGDIANSHAGWLFQKGAIDFAGGTFCCSKNKIFVHHELCSNTSQRLRGSRNRCPLRSPPPHSPGMPTASRCATLGTAGTSRSPTSCRSSFATCRTWTREG